MDLLIPNMELPKDRFTRMMLWPDGGVAIEVSPNNYEQLDDRAIEVPPHTKLTEKSAFWNMLHEICVKCNDSGDIDRYPNRCIWCKIKEAYEKVYQTPTVLEASE